jgi:hypothetical protein
LAARADVEIDGEIGLTPARGGAPRVSQHEKCGRGGIANVVGVELAIQNLFSSIQSAFLFVNRKREQLRHHVHEMPQVEVGICSRLATALMFTFVATSTATTRS